jgi:RNA polymerase sigma factor for flagellar operon FliA
MISPNTLCPFPSSPADPVALLDLVDRALAGLAPRLPSHIDRDDLLSAGREALVQSTRRFTGSLEEARAFCFVRVRGAMLDELRRLDPLARRRRERVRAVTQADHALTYLLDRSPSPPEIAAHIGLSGREVLAALADLAAEAAGTPILDENYADPTAPSPVYQAEQGDILSRLLTALERLPPKQAHAVRRYHLDDVTLDIIGHELGVSRERARQLRAAGEDKLRADFEVLDLWNALLG